MSPVSHRRPTIIDIAHDTGLSKSLVSLALSGRPGVGEVSRRRILEAADRLGYQRNTWASSLVKGRTQLVGVIATDIASAYNADVITGIEDATDGTGYSVLLAHGRRDGKILGDRVRQMLQLGVDGLIIVSSRVPADVVSSAAAERPVVIVGRPDTVPDEVDLIRNDDKVGGRLAVRHLQDLGHARIGFVATSDRAAIRAREGAYRELVGTPWVLRRDPKRRRDLAADVMTRLRADGADAPTALFIATDGAASRVVGAALDAGLRIPQDLAVVGYNNSELATALRPTLTSVDQPRHQMGTLALSLLLERLQGRAEQRIHIMEPTLRIRGTTVPV